MRVPCYRRERGGFRIVDRLQGSDMTGLPRLRFRGRHGLLGIAGIGVLLAGSRFYDEGPGNHLLAWRLHSSNLKSRRSAAVELGRTPSPYRRSDPAEVRYTASVLLASLSDPDPAVRANAADSLARLT